MLKCNRCEEDDSIYYNNYVEKLLCKRCDGCSEIIEIKNDEKEDVKLKRGSCNRCHLDTKINRAGICLPCHKSFSIEKEDIINKPNHYHSNGIDPIGLGKKIFTEEEMCGFYKMNILKYRMRAGKKAGNSKEQDEAKAEFYEKKLQEVYDARIFR